MTNQTKPQYTSNLIECPHCSNTSQMEIIVHVEKNQDEAIKEENYWHQYHRKWDILLCHNCSKVVVKQSTYYSEWEEYEYDDDGEIVGHFPGIVDEMLYPHVRDFQSTPKEISKLYRDAKRLIHIDPDSALVKIRRVLEAVCKDKNAVGKELSKKLQNLANRNIIPQTLATITDQLRKIGNLGAHENSDLKENLTEDDAILALKLAETILEYVYEAPGMLRDLENRLGKLKS